MTHSVKGCRNARRDTTSRNCKLSRPTPSVEVYGQSTPGPKFPINAGIGLQQYNDVALSAKLFKAPMSDSGVERTPSPPSNCHELWHTGVVQDLIILIHLMGAAMNVCGPEGLTIACSNCLEA